MTVQAMGYFWVGTSKLDDWTSFATGQLGLQPVDRGGAMRAFRMDDRKQRLIVDGGLPDGERFFGWEVADAAALDALAARLEKAGVAVRRETAAVADQRCAAEVISFRDPAGNRVEAFHGGQIADEPFRPTRHIAGFRTGTQGMGHAVLMVPDIDAALTFYRDLLGFRITDFMGPPVSLYFMHVNTRHHSLAIAQGPRSRMHHLMMEFYSLDDVGQSYDIAQREDRVAGEVRSASERFHDVILHAHAVGIPDRAWMGWPRRRPRLAASRAEIRRQFLGAPGTLRIAG